MAARALVLGLLWWVVTEGDSSALAVGLPVVALAVLASFAFGSATPTSVSPIGLGLLVLFFLGASLRGGIDVALRALSRRMSLDPGFLDYPLTLPRGPGRIVFLIALSLTPGTLTVELAGDTVRVHALVARAETMHAQIAALERRVAGAFPDGTRHPEPDHG